MHCSTERPLALPGTCHMGEGWSQEVHMGAQEDAASSCMRPSSYAHHV